MEKGQLKFGRKTPSHPSDLEEIEIHEDFDSSMVASSKSKQKTSFSL